MLKGTRQTQPKRGRPALENPDNRILKNGFFARQWKQIQADAKARGNVSAGQIQREIVDWYYAAKLSATEGSIAKPEDDRKHEELITGNKTKSKNQ